MKLNEMRKTLSVLLCLSLAGCGHYPAQIGSRLDIFLTSQNECMINIDGLDIKDWPRLQKFNKLEHLRIDQRMAPLITDAHLQALGRLELPKLRDLNLNGCCNVTDAGIAALTNLTAITSLGLRETRISDEGIPKLIEFAICLKGVNLEGCTSLTVAGVLNLKNAPRLEGLGLSTYNFTQAELEQIIDELRQVTWWGIADETRKLQLEPLLRIKEQRKLIIVLKDGNAMRGVQSVMESGYETPPKK